MSNCNLKQLDSEIKCFERKLDNLRAAIGIKNLSQIEIEFSNVISNFEEVKNEFYYVDEELSTTQEIIISVASCY